MVEDLFALAHAPGSRLLILGIANTVDLVQQLLRPGAAFHVSFERGARWRGGREGAGRMSGGGTWEDQRIMAGGVDRLSHGRGPQQLIHS